MKLLTLRLDNMIRQVNWKLLLFLVLVVNVKMPVKIAAILLFLLLNRKLFFESTIYKQRFIWFYFSMIAIGILNLLIDITSFTWPYFLVFSVGIFFWLLCIGAAFILSWYVIRTELPKLHATVTVFFLLNALVSLVQLSIIMIDSGSLNPYLFQGMRQKYFINTGDLITGLSLDVSTTNALFNAFGIVYFLQRDKMYMVILCMVVLLLTASNFTNILMVAVFAFIFLFNSTRARKSLIVVCCFFLFIFIARVSPQNNNYMVSAYNKIFNTSPKRIALVEKEKKLTDIPDSLLTNDQKKKKIASLYLDSVTTVELYNKTGEAPIDKPIPVTEKVIVKPALPKPDIHSEPYQRRRDTSLFQKKLLEVALKEVAGFDTSLQQTKSRKIPGKLIAFRQTFSFLKDKPLAIITGNGMGKFSSKLAFRATGLKMAGEYPGPAYIHEDFKSSHLKLYFDYFSKDIELHSLVNSPNSVYNQLLSEYGLLGVTAFFILYLGFFLKQRRTAYGLSLLLVLLAAFWVDYWYEQLSIVLIFEFLFLINLKELNREK